MSLSLEGEKSWKRLYGDSRTQEAGSALAFCFFMLVSSSATGAAHVRRKSRELFYGLPVTWAEPGEFSDPEIRTIVIRIRGRTGVCHITDAAQQARQHAVTENKLCCVRLCGSGARAGLSQAVHLILGVWAEVAQWGDGLV